MRSLRRDDLFVKVEPSCTLLDRRSIKCKFLLNDEQNYRSDQA